jgi:hypothetical protein
VASLEYFLTEWKKFSAENREELDEYDLCGYSPHDDEKAG